jgi:hypothetical protein
MDSISRSEGTGSQSIMIMSEYMSIKTLQYQELEFRRELERRRITYERLAEQSERRRIIREANGVARLASKPRIGYRLLAALSARGEARSASAKR